MAKKKKKNDYFKNVLNNYYIFTFLVVVSLT